VAPTPKVTITTPQRASFLPTGTSVVEGNVVPVTGATASTVMLNGVSVPLDSTNHFSSTVTIVEGLNVLQASCTDSSGQLGATAVGVLAGTFNPSTNLVPQAAVVRVDQSSFDAISALAESGILGTDWTAFFQSKNPIYATGFAFIHLTANITQVRYRGVHCALAGKPGLLGASVTIDQPIIDATVAVDLGLGTLGPYPAQVTADNAVITADIGAAAQPNGTVAFTGQNTVTNFQNFNLAITSGGVIDAIVQTFAEGAISDALKSYIDDAVTNMLPQKMQTALATLQNRDPIDVLGKSFSMDIRAEQITLDPSGVFVSAAFSAYGTTPTALSLTAPGSLATAGAPPSTVTNRGFFATVDDDTLNRAFYGLWEGGCLDIDLDAAFFAQRQITMPIQLNVGEIKMFLPEVAGLMPDSTPVMLRLSPALPPVARVSGTPDIAHIQAGEFGIEVMIDRGSGWERLFKAVAHADVGIELAFSTQGLTITSGSTPTFIFDIVDEPIVRFDHQRIDTALSVVLTPLVPHFINTIGTIFIPHLNQLQTLNVTIYPDGPALEHITVVGEMTR
jgi:hypothetical protein